MLHNIIYVFTCKYIWGSYIVEFICSINIYWTKIPLRLNDSTYSRTWYYSIAFKITQLRDCLHKSATCCITLGQTNEINVFFFLIEGSMERALKSDKFTLRI